MRILTLTMSLALAFFQNLEPRVIERVEPVYPPVARAARVQGSVKLSVKVGPDGRASDATIVTGHPLLNEAAIQTVKQWKFAVTPTGGVADITLPFVLPATLPITGRVVDPEGRPIAGVLVRTARLLYWEGLRDWGTSLNGATTDDRGMYRLGVADAGSYYVTASYRGATAGGPNLAPLTFHPGTLDGATAVPLTVASGPEAVADIRIPRVETLQISGKVLLPPGERATGTLEIRLYQLAAGFTAQQIAGQAPLFDGGEIPFNFQGLRPGAYEMIAALREAPQAGPIIYRYSARVPIELRDRDSENITAVLQRRVDMKGRVISQNPLPRSEPLRVSLRPRENTSEGASAAVAADGTFTIPNIPEGKYSVRLNNVLGNGYIADLRFGPLSIHSEGVVTVTNQPPEDLQIMIAANGGSIDGVVQGRLQQGVNAQVMLVPDFSRRQNPIFYKNVKSEASGSFRFEGLPPGEYKVFAFEVPPPSGATENAEFIAQYEQRGVRVIVREGIVTSSVMVQQIPKP